MFRFQHVFLFLLQIVPLERNKTRLKLNQTLAKQKRSKLNKRIYINVTRKCKAISSSVYWSSNLSQEVTDELVPKSLLLLKTIPP